MKDFTNIGKVFDGRGEYIDTPNSDSDILEICYDEKVAKPYTFKEIFKDVVAWFEENNISGEEDFYQVDEVQENLGDLGILVFNFLLKCGLYKPKQDDDDDNMICSRGFDMKKD